MSWLAEPFKGQKFSSIKKDLVKKGELFVDKEFPPNNKSLYFSKVDNEIEWKRPKELCKVPKLVVEGVSTDDLNEGELGNSWFVSACSCLARDPRLWQKVVPNHREQEWSVENQYAGIFHFQFWRYGRYVDVVVDDMLPTREGKLITCHSSARNEFWSALLEKAYAKMYGDYESLKTGFTADALVDFTGGVAERLELNFMDLTDEDIKHKLFYDLKNAADNRAFIVCKMLTGEGEGNGEETDEGLVKGYGYGVTSVIEVKVHKSLKEAVGTDVLRLLRLRNPWSDHIWNGPWSDESPEFKSLPQRDRESMGIMFELEGEFWMPFTEFIKHFTNVDICHFVNTAIFTLKKTWSEAMMHGEWMTGVTGSVRDRAGGCEQHPKTFLRNPQYVFDIVDAEDNIMLSLEQDDTTSHKMSGQRLNQIGFHIMRVEQNRKFRVHIAGEKILASDYMGLRNIFMRVNLTRGRFVVIPSTHKPEQLGKFLLRIYTSKNASVRELIEECPKPGPLCCGKPYITVTRLRVMGAKGLQSAKPNSSVSPLVTMKCEGESLKSDWIRDTSDPEWFHFHAIFYRRKIEIPITLEVISHKTVMDEFLGMVQIEELGSEEPKVLELQLYGKGKKEQDVEKPGKLILEITGSDDLTAL